MMVRRLLCVLLFSMLPLSVGAQEVPGGFIRTSGRDLVDEQGRVFLIRGIGLGNWLMPEGYMFKFKTARYPRQIFALFRQILGEQEAEVFWQRFRDRYVSEDDIRHIAEAGFNTVRVPLHYGLFLADHDPFGADSDRPLRFEGPGWDLLDRLVGWCRQAGLRVIIDLHAVPGGQTGINHDDGTGFPLVLYVRRDRLRTIALWREIARRYANDPTVLGYEPLNEPISTYHDEDVLNPRLEPLYREIADAIRAQDPRHILFLAAAQWDQNMSVFGPPFADNLVYVYHQFWSSTRRDALQDYVNFSMVNRVPILLGEAGEAGNQWNRDYSRLNESFGFGWSFWTYKNMGSLHTMAWIRPPAGWDKIAALGSMKDPSLEKVGLTRAEGQRILDAYLDAIRFPNVVLNPCYAQSLGLGRTLSGPCLPERE